MLFRSGLQGFSYDLRTAILPFIFLFNTDLLMIAGVTSTGGIIWLDDYVHIAWIFFAGLTAMFAFASAIQGWLVRSCTWIERVFLLFVSATTFRPGFFAEHVPIDRLETQILGVVIFYSLVVWQKLDTKRRKHIFQKYFKHEN